MTIGTPSTNVILKDQLFLGNIAAAQSAEHRKKLGITHIVSVCHEYPPTGGETNTHLHIPVEDTEYEDLLIHLPKACRFIQDALENGGRVLVHCVMGVSRSTTVVAAFMMKNRKMDARSALRYIKQRRPQVHPNYGFIKQLDTYAKCQFEPSPTNPVYRSWKKRQEQDVTCFLNQLVDTVSIIPDKLLLSSDFPEDSRQAESLLADLGITHILSISPAEIPPSALSATLTSKTHYRYINVNNNAKEDLLLALPSAVKFLEDAMNEKDGLVLVHSQMEVRACTVACACLMKQRNLAPDEAFSAIEDILPLFNPTVNFSRNLELYDACGYQPTRDHPVVEEWLSPNGPDSPLVQSGNFNTGLSPKRPPNPTDSKSYYQPPLSPSTPQTRQQKAMNWSPQPYTPSSSYTPTASSSQNQPRSDTDLEARARDILSETGLDLSAFGNALRDIESRSVSGVCSRGRGSGSAPGRRARGEIGFPMDDSAGSRERSIPRRQKAA